MAKSLVWPLVVVTGALGTVLFTAQQPRVVCAVLPPGCSGSMLAWSLACDVFLVLVAGLLALAALRLARSVRRQRTHTHVSLQPLLALPAIPAPTDLNTLLRQLGLDGCTRVIALQTPVALCYGLLRPRLLLSTGACDGLSGAEMEAVLRHEQAHLQRRDPLRLVTARALADALPEIPALRQVAAQAPLAQELAADRAAIAAVGPAALGTALLKVGEGLGPLHGQELAVGAFSAQDARIDQLLGAPLPLLSPLPRTIMPTACVVLLSPLLCLLLPLAWCITLAPAALVLSGRHWQQHKGPSQGR